VSQSVSVTLLTACRH